MTKFRTLLAAGLTAVLSVRIFMPLMMSTALTLAVAGPLGLQALDARNATETAETAPDIPPPASEPATSAPEVVEDEPIPEEPEPDDPVVDDAPILPTTSRAVARATTSTRPRTTTTRRTTSTTTPRSSTTTATSTTSTSTTSTTTSSTSTSTSTTTTTEPPPPVIYDVVPIGGLEPGRSGLIGVTITGGVSGADLSFQINTTNATVIESIGTGWSCGSGASTRCTGQAPGENSATVYVRVDVQSTATSVTFRAQNVSEVISARAGQLAARFATQSNGSVTVIGNQQLSCSASQIISAIACPLVQSRSPLVPIGLDTNNRWSMAHINADNRGGLTAKSNSTGATLDGTGSVVFAGLYWGSMITSPTIAKAGTVKFATPASTGGSVPSDNSDYITITGSDLSTSGNNYQMFADVTSLVSASGSGDYWLADMSALTGTSRYGGWSLVVVRNSTGVSQRDIVVFDGYTLVNQAAPEAEITIGGFRFPDVNGSARLSLVAYEGETRLGPDGASIDGQPISDGANPATDLFNSTISQLGVPTTARFPAYGNTLGFDIDTFDVSSLLRPGARGANIALTTGADAYAVGVATITVDR